MNQLLRTAGEEGLPLATVPLLGSLLASGSLFLPRDVSLDSPVFFNKGSATSSSCSRIGPDSCGRRTPTIAPLPGESLARPTYGDTERSATNETMHHMTTAARAACTCETANFVGATVACLAVLPARIAQGGRIAGLAGVVARWRLCVCASHSSMSGKPLWQPAILGTHCSITQPPPPSAGTAADTCWA